MTLSDMMKPVTNQVSSYDLSLTCPHCGVQVMAKAIPGVIDVLTSSNRCRVGLRECNNPACSGVIFIAIMQGEQRVITVPPYYFKYNQTDIPAPVLSAFDEAITCFTNSCYMASAMLLRKSIELICEDRGSSGKNLKEKIDNLRHVVILPPEFLSGMHNLRYLGNDAAHVDADTYRQVSQRELQVGIQVTMELIHALYQYKNSLDQLEELKKPEPEQAETL